MLGVLGLILTIFNNTQHVLTRWPNGHNMLLPTMLRYSSLVQPLPSFGRGLITNWRPLCRALQSNVMSIIGILSDWLWFLLGNWLQHTLLPWFHSILKFHCINFIDSSTHFQLIVIAVFLRQYCPREKGAMRLTQCKAPTCETRLDHNTGNYVPYSFW